MSARWDETWHRLQEWTNGQAQSERLAAQILLSEGYCDLDPSHPLGGPDGAKDALCQKNGKSCVMAVYFPRGQQPFRAIKRKFRDDLLGVSSNKADALAFVTNQELSLSQRQALKKVAGVVHVDLYHLERITVILDKPIMSPVRKQYLGIDFDPSMSTLEDALDVLLGPGRQEDEIRDAYFTLCARTAELLSRVEPGKSRCTSCFSDNVTRRFGDYNGRSFDITRCNDCGEILDCCI